MYTALNPETRTIEHRGAVPKKKRKKSEIGKIKMLKAMLQIKTSVVV